MKKEVGSKLKNKYNSKKQTDRSENKTDLSCKTIYKENEWKTKKDSR